MSTSRLTVGSPSYASSIKLYSREQTVFPLNWFGIAGVQQTEICRKSSFLHVMLTDYEPMLQWERLQFIDSTLRYSFYCISYLSSASQLRCILIKVSATRRGEYWSSVHISEVPRRGTERKSRYDEMKTPLAESVTNRPWIITILCLSLDAFNYRLCETSPRLRVSFLHTK